MGKNDRTTPTSIPLPDSEERRREAVRDTVKRGARGNVQLAHGRFVTPRDKSLTDTGRQGR